MKKENGVLTEVNRFDLELLKNNPKKFWEGVEVIGANAFQDSKVEEIVVPNTVKKLAPRAFCGCKTLTVVALPESIDKVSQYCFQWCWSLTKVLLPQTIVEIGENAFAGCEKIEKIFIPDSVKKISSYAFAHCHNLQKITIPANVESVGFGAFYCDKKLKEVYAMGNTKFHKDSFVGTNENLQVLSASVEVEMA